MYGAQPIILGEQLQSCPKTMETEARVPWVYLQNMVQLND
jgi:hypothetical protein